MIKILKYKYYLTFSFLCFLCVVLCVINKKETPEKRTVITIEKKRSSRAIKIFFKDRNNIIEKPIIKKHKEITGYDSYFKFYSAKINLDWRLMAAQCIQESFLDPNANSPAGAIGLMQIMPKTAGDFGIQKTVLTDPETNIAVAAMYIYTLMSKFQDIPQKERILYVIASYNGGYSHIRDAMELAKATGKDKYKWSDISFIIQNMHFYNIYKYCKFGKMDGQQTVNYVNNVMYYYYYLKTIDKQ